MDLKLKRFYQAVDLEAPDKVLHFLVFDKGDGKEILLPVPKETTEELIRKLYADERTETKQAEVEEEDLEGAVEFSAEDGNLEGNREAMQRDPDDLGDVDSEAGFEAPAPVAQAIMKRVAAQRMFAESEDEVPSL